MSSYNPEANLRILLTKQRRIQDEAWAALLARVWMEVSTGYSRNSQEWKDLDDEWTSKDGQAYFMYDVIHFLQEEVERVGNDKV